MKIRTIFYLMGQGFMNIIKNQLMSFASITTISACIFMVGIFYTVSVNMDYMLDAIETTMGMTVFFDEGTSEEQIIEIKGLLEARNEVHKVNYISPEEAWTNFKNEYFSGREDQLAGFEGENPLKDSASLEVYFARLETQKDLVAYIESLPNVRNIRQAEQVVEIMQSFNTLVRYSSLVLVAILLIISIFLISNTIRLGISTRQKEIEIMKYIGAKDAFIKGPFIIEGAIIGIIGAVIPLSIIYVFYEKVIDVVTTEFVLISNYLIFMNIMDIYKNLVPMAALFGILIGLIGSRLTIHKYLKV
ncbi:MAG: ABC transporter permease [Firmicutes bacterium HGW-Firmicutes-5]|nr:MAG: ABC transporter permease [Firmicutes bacterium HGW-Firmicutes-5]